MFLKRIVFTSLLIINNICLASDGENMDIENNWNKLHLYWKNLTFEQAKEQDFLIRKSIGDDLSYSDKDIEQLKLLVSAQREFSPIGLGEIEKIEKSLNVKLPDDYKKSLKINSKEVVKDEFVYPWLGSWNTLHDTSEIIKYSLRNREMDHEVFQIRNGLSDEYGFWNKKWVIFFDWNMDFLAVLDLREDEKYYGQVLCLCIEDGSISKWANSFSEWFELSVNETIKHGELRVTTIDNVLRMQQ